MQNDAESDNDIHRDDRTPPSGGACHVPHQSDSDSALGSSKPDMSTAKSEFSEVCNFQSVDYHALVNFSLLKESTATDRSKGSKDSDEQRQADISRVIALIATIARDKNNVKKLQEQVKIDMHNSQVSGNYSVLHRAAEMEILRILIEEEEFSSSPETSLNRTPLHLAAQHGQLEIVKYLVCNQSADPSYRDQYGLNALHHACINGSLEVVTFLVDKMSEYTQINTICNKETESGNTAVHYSAERGHVNLLKFFLQDLNCDPNMKGKIGRTLLHSAAKGGHLHVLKYLIEEKKM